VITALSNQRDDRLTNIREIQLRQIQRTNKDNGVIQPIADHKAQQRTKYKPVNARAPIGGMGGLGGGGIDRERISGTYD